MQIQAHFFRRSFSALIHNDFVRGVAVTVANRGVLIVLGMVTSVLVARGLGPEARGEYAYISTVLAIVSQFSLLGLHSANVVFVSQDSESLRGLFSNSLVVSFCLGLVSFVILMGWDCLFQNSFLVDFWFAMLLTILFQGSVALCQQLNLGAGNIRWYNYAELAPAVLVTLIVVVFFCIRSISVSFLLCSGAFSAGCGFVVSVLGLRGALSPVFFKPDWSLFKRCFNYGWRIYVVCVCSFFISRAEIVFGEPLVTSSELGEYAIALGIFSLSLMPIQVVAALLLQKISSKDAVNRLDVLVKVVRFLSPVVASVVLLLYFFADFVVFLLYGAEYGDSAKLFRIMLIGYLPSSLASLFSSFVASSNLPMYFVWSYVLVAFVKCAALSCFSVLSVEILACSNVLFLIVTALIVLFAAYKEQNCAGL